MQVIKTPWEIATFTLEHCSVSLSWRVPLFSVISVINTELLSETLKHQTTLSPGPTVAIVKQGFLQFAVRNQVFQVISFQFVRNVFLFSSSAARRLFPWLTARNFSWEGCNFSCSHLAIPATQMDPLLLTAWIVQLLRYRLKKVKTSLHSLQNNHT